MVDTSTECLKEEEKSHSEKANSSPKTASEDSKRDSTTTVEYQELIKAIQRGDLFKTIEFANKKKHLFIGKSPKGNTVLHIAARYGNWLMVDKILRCDDENKSLINESLIYTKNDKDENPLHIAAKYGNVLVVWMLLYHEDENRMLEKGLLKMKDKEGNTPLHNAVRHGHELIAQSLIDSDVTVIQEPNNLKQTPLSIAIDARLNYIACYIIEKDVSSLKHEGPEKLTLLHSAVMRQDYDTVVYILKNTEDDLINKKDAKEWTPLHYAAASGHVKIARYLAKVNALLVYEPDIHGQTPLHLAAKNDRPGVLKMLLKDCPDSIEMTDSRHRNVLHVAAEKGNVKIVSFILRLPEMKDLVNSGDEDGNTPLHLAAMEFQSDVVYIFSQYIHVNVRATNKKKQTALEIVLTSKLKGKAIQKHLTTKALKAAYADRGLYEEDIQLDRSRLEAAHSKRSKEGEDVQLEHRRFAAIKDLDGEGGKGKEMAQTLSVMNTLIATFTFTAAFTLPGGFRSDGPEEGTAVLVGRTSFQAFVITDTLSMTSSMTAAVIVFWSFWCSKSESFMDSLPWAIGLTWIGLVSMTLAFVTGLYVVLSENMALAITVSAIGCAFPLIFYVFAPVVSLLSGQSASVNPFAFSFKMVKILLKKPLRKPIAWCFRCLSKRSCIPIRMITFLFAALIPKFIFGCMYYFIKATVIAVSRLIKESVIGLSKRCCPGPKSSEEPRDQLPK